MELPRLWVNCKTYPEASGAALTRLAKALQLEARKAAAPVALCPPLPETAAVARLRLGRIQVWAQHCDDAPSGATTGWFGPSALRAAGAVGTVLNHAERKIPRDLARDTKARCLAEGLPVLFCADSIEEARSLARLKPLAIAIEPPELIGGDVSVTTADAAIVSDAVEAVRRVSPKTKVLCGAGVKTGYDAARALELGAYGVLVSSGIVKARRPAVAARDLLFGLAS